MRAASSEGIRVVHAERETAIQAANRTLQVRRRGRCSGCDARCLLHCLEIMEGVLTSAAERRFLDFQSRCERPAPLPVNFPDNESAR